MKNIARLLISFLFSGTIFAMGSKTPEGLSLLLVPAEPAMVQLGMDIAAKQHALLMTYAPETPADESFIHIWDGSKWLRVSHNSYESGTFIVNAASRVLVVGAESELTAGLIGKALVWSPEVLHLGSGNVTELINQMGRLYGFKRNEWEWFAQRYSLDLENLNRERVQTSWYDQNKASNLPPSDKPWQKHTQMAAPQPPETSLTPMMPPANVLRVEKPETVIEIEVDSTESNTPVDFSLELE